MALYDMGRNIATSNQQTPTLLILSPHPDDLELSCGLLCHQAMLLGWRLYEIILTDGSAGGIDTSIFHTDKLRQLRIAEARSGGALLGVEEIEFWGFPDSKLNLSLEPAIASLQNRLELLSPTILVFPSPSDTHPDHSGTHMVAMSTLEKYQNEFATLQYCFWGKDENQNVVLAHEPGVQAKESAVRQHKTQPIDQYLGRLYGKEKRIDGYEQYYSPNPEKTVSALSHYGFNIKLT